MRRIIISVASLIVAIILGYFSYYYFFELKNEIAATVFIIIAFAFFLNSLFFLFLFISRNSQKKIEDLKNQVKLYTDISYHVSQAGDEAFNKLPVGIVVYDESHEIKWANDYSKTIFKSELVKSPLETISRDLVDGVTTGKTNIILKYNDASYDVVHNSQFDILYFFDVTRREQIIKKYNERVTALGIIGLDNLEESLKKYDMQEKANLRGQILGEVSDWAASFGCYLQTLSNDRMLIVLDRDSLDKMIMDKFSVLSKVREISSKSRLKSSLSMGIASYDVESDELGQLAQNAIELAEKRGGDQVVVNIQGEKIQYFGGNTNSLEKNTLVETRMQAQAIKEAIEDSSNVLIMCHNLADSDAIGSTLAAYHLAISSNKDAKIVFEPEKADITVKKIYENIENDSVLKNYFVTEKQGLELIKASTLLIICDTQSPKRVMFPSIYEKASKVSIIDHHRAGDVEFNNLVSNYVETSASSAVELVTEMFMFYNDSITLNALEASIMLAGIVVDTNNFTFRSGTRTFEAASTLRGMGADMVFVRKLLRESIGVEQTLAQALMRAEIFEQRFAIVKLDDSEIVSDRTTLAKISDKLLGIDNVDTSFTIGRISENQIGVSARSLDNVNVQVIMEIMGGGGHYNSAATQINDTNVNAVHDELIEILKREYGNDGDEKMKVILLEDVKGKGKKDQVIDVANGYGNYLITNKLAIVASDENLENLAKQKEQEKIDEERRRAVLTKLKSEIQDKFISIYIKVGADGKSFGHITSKLVCDEFEAQTGIHLDKKKVEIPAEINSVGIFTASVKLEKDIIASFEINVIEKKD